TGVQTCSLPISSNDGQGVTNVELMNTNFVSLGDVTYEDHTATVVDVFQGWDTNLQVTFATGYTYGTNVWIDFNDNLAFEASELVYSGRSEEHTSELQSRENLVCRLLL